jgi:uncharacterized membrane protein YhaH (DUF805 family)/cold shock CspA family protein
MRGEVLHYDPEQGFGFITGSDGARYTFAHEDLRRDAVLGRGTAVEFQPSGGQAKSVFAIRQQMGGQTAGAGSRTAAHFGRNAALAPAVAAAAPALSLWGYFTQVLTANYANFRVRARRKEYWGFILFWTLSTIVLSAAGVAVDAALGRLEPDSWPIASIAVPVLWILATLLPGIAVTVRRQHDIGLSGWFYLLILLPYVGGLIIFVFTLIPSQRHENKWGPVPDGVSVPPPYAPAAPA